MFIGLSHIGLMTKNLEESLHSYQNTHGFTILSDAERKGEWGERVTGIPGFHSRTVYLSVTPYQHLEAFEFFHIKPVPAQKEPVPWVRIFYLTPFLHRGSEVAGKRKQERDL